MFNKMKLHNPKNSICNYYCEKMYGVVKKTHLKIKFIKLEQKKSVEQKSVAMGYLISVFTQVLFVVYL